MADTKPGTGIHKVIGGCAVVRLLDGSERYLYKHAVFDAAGADEKSVKHLVSVGLIEKTVEPEKPEASDEGPYKGVTVADLKAEIDKRNEGRPDDAKLVPAEPGNRPQIVAALLADDATQ